MLNTMKEIAGYAGSGSYAIGAFHAVNLEQVQGILEAAVEQKAPVIISLDEQAALYAGLRAFKAMALELAQDIPIPAAILLERIRDPDLIKEALAEGYSGVLVDPGETGLLEAADQLKSIKDLCLKQGAFFEMGLKVNTLDFDPDMAARVIKEVEPDSVCLLASPEEKEKPEPGFFELLEKTAPKGGRPISIAGAGSWPEPEIKKAIRLGAWKISVGTRTNRSFSDGLRSYLASNPDRVHPRAYLGAALESFRAEVEQCIRIFESTKSI